MRTPLFLSTLFAVSLLGGAALADKPVRAMESLRAHGDTVDKSYRAAERPAIASSRAASHETTAARTSRSMIDHSASRVNCSEAGAECATGGGGSHAAMAETASGATGRAMRAPAFLDKILGSDRTNFNEADMDQGMSKRAANRAWEHAGRGAGAGHAASSLAQQTAVDRKENQASTNRVSCNEGDQCMDSSKQAKRDWSYLAVKAGTWQGPEAKQSARTPAAAAKSAPAPDASRAAGAAAAARSNEHQD
jgi:hypothetical protein